VTLKYFNVKNGLTTGNITLNAGNSNISANTFIGNINVTSSANLGSTSNVIITGGTNGYVLSTDGTGNLSWVAQSGGSASNIAILDEGVTLTNAVSSIDFVGSGVTATANGNAITVTISGGGSGTPGGSNTQVQFNDSNTFAGNAGLTFDKTTTTLTANNFVATSSANLGAVGNVSITGGSNGYVLQTNGSGVLSWVEQSGGGGAAANVVSDSFTGNGVQNTFTLTSTPLNKNYVTVNYNGIVLLKEQYTLSGSSLTLDFAPADSSKLDVVSIVGVAGGVAITDDTTTDATYYPMYATANSGTLGIAGITTTKLQFNPSSGQLTVQDLNMLSDATLKENPTQIADPFSILNQLFGMSFNWTDTGKKSYGLLAQMLEQVLPELVSTNAQGKKTVNYIPIIAFLIEAVKKQQQDIEDLKKR
jgi:hypothetical protein